MSISVHCEVLNLNSVVSQLQEIGAKAARIHEGLEKSGEIVRADAAMNAPVDTGRLRGSIVNNVEGDTAHIGTNVNYAVYVEFGTGSKGDPAKSHTTKSSWRYQDAGGQWRTSSGQAPQPYLVPALKNNVDKIVEEIRNAIIG